MFENFFGSKEYTSEDLLKELLHKHFDEEKIEKIYSSGLDLNWKNKNTESYLHLCATHNMPSSIQWLIKKGLNLNLKTQNGKTALFYAVENGSFEAFDVLITKNADIGILDNNNRSILQEAVRNKQLKIVKTLLHHPYDINNIDLNGNSILFDAILSNDLEMIKLILNLPKLNLNQKDSSGNTVLFYDIIYQNQTLILPFVKQGIDMAVKNSKGNDFVFNCLQNNSLSKEFLQTVLAAGYDINQKCNHQTLLLKLLEKEKPNNELIGFLIANDIKIDEVDENKENVLYKVVKNNDLSNTELFLDEKILNINHKNSDGNTVLVYAALKGEAFLNMITLLLRYGANPNIVDNNGSTIIEKLIDVILHYSNKKEISESLLKYINANEDYMFILKEIFANSKVLLRKLNSLGKPLFFDPVFYGNNPLFDLLKSHGSDINQKDKDSKNILHNLLTMMDSPIFKEEKNFHKLLHKLMYYGADVNSKDEEGSSTTHNAILLTNEHTVKVLLDAKADIKALDNRGRSLVHNCVWNSKLKHFRLIHSYNESMLNMPDKYGILPINYAAFIGHTQLVLEMITSRAHVNNPHKKSEKMVSFFRKFYKNVYNLNKNLKDEYEKKNIEMLINNMKKEFNLPD